MIKIKSPKEVNKERRRIIIDTITCDFMNSLSEGRDYSSLYDDKELCDIVAKKFIKKGWNVEVKKTILDYNTYYRLEKKDV